MLLRASGEVWAVTMQQIFEERGYIVITSSQRFEVGEVLDPFTGLLGGQYNETQLKIVAETDHADYRAQSDLQHQNDGESAWPYFYRIVAE